MVIVLGYQRIIPENKALQKRRSNVLFDVVAVFFRLQETLPILPFKKGEKNKQTYIVVCTAKKRLTVINSNARTGEISW